MRILYLEDNPNDANLVDRYIQTTAHDLVVVSSIDEAWSVLQESVDLILIDILLDNERLGYNFAHELRDRHMEQPLIAVTALGTPPDMAATQRAGFDAVLTKPFEITQLAQVIHQYGG